MARLTASDYRQRRGTALKTLDIDNHRGRGPECRHAPSILFGARWVAMPAIWRDDEGVYRDTTVGALLCPLCHALFEQTGGRPDDGL